MFFLGEDFWEIPIQRVRGATRPMEPYYVTMRLPGEDTVEFALIMPFTPRDRENTVAWLAGRSDGEHFGKLRNFRFPAGVLAFGPSQVENRIEQNATISQQLTLWDSSGSEVLRSTLMMIPVGNSFLYVQPVYLQAAGGRMPELRRVIVANGNAVAMEETFERALQMVMADRAPGEPPPVPGGPDRRRTGGAGVVGRAGTVAERAPARCFSRHGSRPTSPRPSLNACAVCSIRLNERSRGRSRDGDAAVATREGARRRTHREPAHDGRGRVLPKATPPRRGEESDPFRWAQLVGAPRLHPHEENAVCPCI